MSNKLLIPFVLLLLGSLVYNVVKIDQRMDFLKNENGYHLMGIVISIVGIIFCLVIFRFNSVNSMINKAKND